MRQCEPRPQREKDEVRNRRRSSLVVTSAENVRDRTVLPSPAIVHLHQITREITDTNISLFYSPGLSPTSLTTFVHRS
jgi:hypothetical protein